ncbi:MAG: hypothetical protein OXC46_01595, partial [Thaumarchaeota archaeon]|nr:hypothetical protein [Nitrososphaerota archaeon]
LQKIAYFCKYLGWNVGYYQLDYYGPFSGDLTDTIKTAENIGLIKQGDSPLHTFELTDEGRDFMKKFIENFCDSKKVKNIRKLVSSLSNWGKGEIEIATTIDFVKRNSPDLKKNDLLDKVGRIRENFKPSDIKNAHEKWASCVHIKHPV